MSESHSSSIFIKRSAWLGLIVGWLAQLGLKTVLPVVVLVGLRFFSVEGENKSLWLENPNDSTHPVWYALQASVFLGSVAAGWLAAELSPRKSVIVPVTLGACGMRRMLLTMDCGYSSGLHQCSPSWKPESPLSRIM